MTKQESHEAAVLPTAPAAPKAAPRAVLEAAPGLRGPHRRIALALQVDEHRCLSCGGCISVCPRMVVPVSPFNSLAEGTLCQGCGLCVQVCPVEALSQAPVFIAEPLRVPGHGDQRHAARVVLPGTEETQ